MDMDGLRFDAMTKLVAERRSRRAVAKALAGGIGAGALALLGAGQTQAVPRTVFGSLKTSDRRFTRCGEVETEKFYYDAYSYRRKSGGPFTLSLARDGFQDPLEDSYLYLYSKFDPRNPCDNIIAEDDDSGCGNDSFISLEHLPAGRYTIVATSFDPEETGDYRLKRNVDQPCPEVALTDNGPK
jgi:hypothetical protein